MWHVTYNPIENIYFKIFSREGVQNNYLCGVLSSGDKTVFSIINHSFNMFFVVMLNRSQHTPQFKSALE